jgi:hypothetical protein
MPYLFAAWLIVTGLALAVIAADIVRIWLIERGMDKGEESVTVSSDGILRRYEKASVIEQERPLIFKEDEHD